MTLRDSALVRVGAAFEQRADRAQVAVPGGIHQSRAVGGERPDGADQSEREAD
jgi:hypothetical protein